MNNLPLIRLCLFAVMLIATSSILAAEYPENRDYGNQGDFIVKRGTEFGRTADLGVIGPLLVNLPEAPGSTSDGVVYRAEDTVWDISDLTNPTLIRSLTCDGCFLGQPIAAHATATRFDNTDSYLYTRNGNPAEGGDWIRFNPDGQDSNSQAQSVEFYNGVEPFAYTMMFSPFFAHSFWNYGEPQNRLQQIRDPARLLDPADDPNEYWLGEIMVEWDHLGDTNVTGFGSWLGNLFIMASDQMSRGMAIYDMSGFRDGVTPRLLSVYNPIRTEPDGHQVGIGGYWVEPYGTTKMVWAARQRDGILPERNFPAIYVVDFSDPINPYLSCEIYFDQDSTSPHDGDGSSDPMYVNFQDQYAFVDHFRVDLQRCEQAYVDGVIDSTEFNDIVFRFDDINNSCDGSQYYRPLGQVGILGGYDWWVTQAKITVTGGDLELNRWHTNQDNLGFNALWQDEQGRYVITSSAIQQGDVIRNSTTGQQFTVSSVLRDISINEQGMCFFVAHDEADTRPPMVSGHIPRANQSNYPVDGFIHIHIPETLRSESLVNAVQLQELDGQGNVVATPVFRQQLSHTGTLSLWPTALLAVDTTYRVRLSGVQDFMGNTMADYSFVFTTGDEVVVDPDPDPDPAGPAPDYAGPAYYPNQSSQLSCADESELNNLWVVNPDNNSVSIIDTELDPSTKELHVVSQIERYLNYQTPTSVGRVGDYYAITYRADDKVVFHDALSTLPVFSIDTGHGSQPVASIAYGRDLLVAAYGSGEIIRINTQSEQIDERLQVGPTPKAMALHNDRLLVTREISPQDHAEVYDLSVAGSLQLSRVILVNKVLVPDDLDHGSGVPNLLSSVAINREGTEALITAVKANTDRGLQRSGVPLDDDNTVRPILIRLDLLNNRDANVNPQTREGTVDFDNAADPSFVTYLVDGQTRVTALQGNNQVLAENLGSNQAAQFATGLAPQGMCSTLRQLYVKNFTDRSVSAIEVAGFIYDGRNRPSIHTVSTVQDELLSTQVKRGKQVFYHSSMPEMGQEGYMSCASCHVDSGGDGRVWDMTALGEGLRNTLSLNGMSGTRFGNLHWTANFDEVQDFELQIEMLNGGEGLIEGATFTGQSPLSENTTGRSADLDALAAYVSSLGKEQVARSPYRNYIGELTAAAQRGQAQFFARGCASCHSGSAFRDGLSHDVGTITAGSGNRLGESLTAVRTPSLVELWQSAPYLHDGSAATLSEVFSIGAHTQSFSGTQQADLEAFLNSIDRELYIDDDATFIPGQDSQAPSTPGNLRQVSTGVDTLQVAWDAATDNVGVAHYRLNLNGVDLPMLFSSTQAQLNDLSPDLDYLVSIVAVDAAGNRSLASAVVEVSTASTSGGGTPVTDLRYFVFGHSLFNHGSYNVGYWLGALAQASGTQAAGNGQFGQLSYHGVPPNRDSVFSYITNAYEPWTESPLLSFSQVDYSHVLFMPSNFEQTGTSAADYADLSYRVLDFVEEQEPGAEIILYMHWPEPFMPGLSVNNINEMSRSDFTTYNNWTASGFYLSWHRDYQNTIMAARPDYDFRTIPVGPVIADMLENLPYLQPLQFSDWYEDDAPHGSPSLHFLAALVCYRALYLANPANDYTPSPALVHSEIRDNMASIIAYIEQRLAHYQAEGLRVYGN